MRPQQVVPSPNGTCTIFHDDFSITCTPASQLHGAREVEGTACLARHKDGRVYRRFVTLIQPESILADYFAHRFDAWWAGRN